MANNWDSDKSVREMAKQANAYFRDLAKKTVHIEEAVEWRIDDSTKIALPSKPSKMSRRKAMNILAAQDEAEQAVMEYVRPFQCRPYAGAFAFAKVLKERYGMNPIGKTQYSFFGSQPPEVYTVAAGFERFIQVPFGLLTFPVLDAEFMLVHREDPDLGSAFAVGVHAKKKYEGEIQGMLDEVERWAQEFNIYNGTAMIGVGKMVGGQYKDAEFPNMYKGLNRKKIVYSTVTQELLEDEVIGLIKNTELLREPYTTTVRYDPNDPLDVEEHKDLIEELGRPVELQYDADGAFYQIEHEPEEVGNKVLLFGEPGTGKTVALKIIAQHCLEEGWAYLGCRPDDDLKKVLRFGETLGCPFVVTIEDAEKLIPETKEEMDSLLEQFDGMRTKGREAIMVLTTNHPEELPKTLMRAGRLNQMIPFGDLDKAAVEKLIKAAVPRHQREELDYEQLHAAYEGYPPNWIAQSLQGTRRRSVIRTGKRGVALATADFVRAANALRDAFDRYKAAKYQEKKPPLDAHFRTMIQESVTAAVDDRYTVDLSDGEIMVR